MALVTTHGTLDDAGRIHVSDYEFNSLLTKEKD